MSIYTDPGCRVPNGSFFNFAYLHPGTRQKTTRQYYGDISLECSSLFTDGNITRIEAAYMDLKTELETLEDSGDTPQLDAIIESYQSTVGPALLAELRKGQDYVTSQYANYRSELSNIYTRKPEKKIFFMQISSGLGSHDGGNPLEGVMNARYLFPREDRRYGTTNLSFYASYLSNMAAWLCRPVMESDVESANLVSLFLARERKGEDETRSRERMDEALAVIAARMCWRTDFVHSLSKTCYDKVTERSIVNNLLTNARWDRDITSLRAPVSTLRAGTWGFAPVIADVVGLCIENRLTRDASAQREDVFVPRLLDGHELDVFVWDGLDFAMQNRTGIFPRKAFSIQLESGLGIPVLAARTEQGHPALLVPADGRTAKFLAGLYGIDLPNPIVPMSGGSMLVWSYLHDPSGFIDVMKRSGKSIEANGERAEHFAKGQNWRGETIFSGTVELAKYLRDVDATGMHVNEYFMY